MIKNLIVVNPKSGKQKATKSLLPILEEFRKNGYVCTVMPTLKPKDAAEIVSQNAEQFNLVTCIGGDGTLNEVVAGITALDSAPPIGYIPAGSTNDFAQSMGIPSDLMAAAKKIIAGSPCSFDSGTFNGRSFTYSASFGAFTEVSYSTNQKFKNTIGRPAYILEGIRSVTDIKSLHLKISTENACYEDDYMFGSISNASSIGGVIHIDPDRMDPHDGLLELLLLKYPSSIAEFTQALYDIKNQTYESKLITFMQAGEFNICADSEVNWSLDGEFQPGADTIKIRTRHNSFRLLL